MDHPNVEPKELVIDDIEPSVGIAYPNESVNMFGFRLSWKDSENEKLYLYSPLRKEDSYVFNVKVFDLGSGKYIDDMDVLKKKRFSDGGSDFHNAKSAFEYIQSEINS